MGKKKGKVTLAEISGKALLTSRQYGREVSLYSTAAFLAAVEARPTTVKGTFRLSGGRFLTVAQNTTGRGETVRLFSPSGKEAFRLFFSSNRFKFPGCISVGRPALKKLEEKGFSLNALSSYNLHKGSYVFTNDYGAIMPHIIRIFKGE